MINSLRIFRSNRKNNIILFFVFFLFYGLLALFFTLRTHITDHPTIITDICFSFDTPILSKNNFIANDSHPLLGFMLKPLFYIASALADLFGTMKAKSVFLALVSSIAISLSLLNIFRYLINIIELRLPAATIIIIFYSFFSTNLILGFSFESYPYSILILTYTIYYYSKSIKENRKIPLLNNIILSVTLGGITITNYIKGIIPIIFQKETLTKKIKRLTIVLGVFFIICLWMEYSYNIFFQAKLRVSSFTPEDLSSKAILVYAIDWFWGAPVFFPQILATPLNSISTGISITCDFYHHWWQYLFISSLASACIYGWLMNYKEKLVYIPVLFFGTDFFIHVICKFGIDESFIYGGHWVFIIPILMGWGYKSFVYKYKHESIALAILLIFLLTLLLNNTIQMISFGRLAIDIFPAS